MTRKEAFQLVRDRGGEPIIHVSQRTSILVVGMEGWPLLPDGRISKKLERAEELNRLGCSIRIMPESVFLEAAGGREPERLPGKTYPAGEVCRFLKLTPETLQRWEQFGLVRSQDGLYDFQDLVSIQTIGNLISHGVRPGLIAKSLRSLAAVLPGTERPLAQLRIIAEHPGVLLVDLAGARLSVTGQLVFDFSGRDKTKAVVIPLDAKELSVDEWFKLGLSCEEEELYPEASECFRTVLTLDPDFPPAYLHLGYVLQEMGILWAAEEFYRIAVVKDPKAAAAWYSLAEVQEELEKIEEAIESLKKAVAVQPDYPDAHFNLALCYDKAGKRAEAVPHWFTFLKLEPGGESAQIARRRLSC